MRQQILGDARVWSPSVWLEQRTGGVGGLGCIMYLPVVTSCVLASVIQSSVIALIRARTILLIEAVREISI